MKFAIDTKLPENQAPVDWVATCYQNRTTNLSAVNLPNCLVTADYGGNKEC